MKIVPKNYLNNLRVPEELHNRVARDDDGQYWISCQLRSTLAKRDYNYYPKHALLVMKKYTIDEDGTIIFEDL